MKAGDVWVSVEEEGGVYILIRRDNESLTLDTWYCLVLSAACYWNESEGELVKNTENWLLASFVKAEDL